MLMNRLGIPLNQEQMMNMQSQDIYTLNPNNNIIPTP